METQYNIEQFNSIIQHRQSVYPYQFEKGKKVPDGIIRQILDNANRAPTHKLTEPWRFTVFTGEGLKSFAQIQSGVYTQYAGEKFKEKKLKNLEEYPLMSSHVIAVGMKRATDIAIPEVEEIIATGCAVENMYLTATAYNLGCYLSTGGITYFKESKSYFGLEEEDKLIGFFYVGYIASPKFQHSKRLPVAEKTKWITS